MIEILTDEASKYLKKLLQAIYVVLGSLFQATQIPGIEILKEFKDMIEITLD